MSVLFRIAVEGGADQQREEIRSILQRITNDFFATSAAAPGFVGFGLHVRGCSCGNCDGSGGIPGGLVVVGGFQSDPCLTPRRKKVDFDEIQANDRLLLNLRDDPVAKTVGIVKKELWGKVIGCHMPDGWHVALEAGIEKHRDPTGLVYHLNQHNAYRIMDLQRDHRR